MMSQRAPRTLPRGWKVLNSRWMDENAILERYSRRFEMACDYDDYDTMLEDYPEEYLFFMSEEGVRFFNDVQNMIREMDAMWEEDERDVWV